MIRRLHVEKKPNANGEARGILSELRDVLGMKGLKNVRLFVRYDVDGLNEEEYEKGRDSVLTEPQVDNWYEDLPLLEGDAVLAIELLPGQYDQRADSAAQCIQIVTGSKKPEVRVAKIYVFQGELTKEEFDGIRRYLVNPVDSQVATLKPFDRLRAEAVKPESIKTLDGFIAMDRQDLKDLHEDLGLAMDMADLSFCQAYFKEQEKRNPTITEIRIIDTYWSDHCRHTTFLTELEEIKIEDAEVKKVFESYLEARSFVYEHKKKPVCLMDVATIGAKEFKKMGMLHNLDDSEEINACSIVVPVRIGGTQREYLVMFKNETHNHPTEIEPFGGAATCLGGAIRDPLSGRSYVYQAMRITGSGDPRRPVEETLSGKLPQRKITLGAAAGYSSYGNQIGLATGMVKEIYHEGYVAKRMELGAVIGAALKENVIRLQPMPGDVIVLLGGETGRDGCGGATGSSKAHDNRSLESCGAEVQKGNPPEERKIQRLFRNPVVSKMIKRCNDFGAGGVSVAIGELADGLRIDLDAVPKKYEGLDGTELAISESQERMAVVIAAGDLSDFVSLCHSENIQATKVAEVVADPRMVMTWRGDTVCSISRAFLNTNGAPKKAKAIIEESDTENLFRYVNVPAGTLQEQWCGMLSDLNVCSQKGLVERFDASIGASSVMMPYGGKYQLTPTECMAAKLPNFEGETDTATLMAHGFNPYLSQRSPFYGAVYAIVHSIAKLVAAGGDYSKAYLTLQEYFERLKNNKLKWGKPLSALLGAYKAQKGLGIAAIGGKDSMSGSFNDLHVPPTLVAIAVTTEKTGTIISPEFKKAGSSILFIKPETDGLLPEFESLKKQFALIHHLIVQKKVLAAHTVGYGGLCETLCLMAFGNKTGVELTAGDIDLYAAYYGGFVLETQDKEAVSLLLENGAVNIGSITGEGSITKGGESVDLSVLINAWSRPLESVFPTKGMHIEAKPFDAVSYIPPKLIHSSQRIASPRVFIPVFPGTNCEYDSAIAFEKAGAAVDTFVFRNLNQSFVRESLEEMVQRIRKAQIVMIPGGFSGGDEPDGSGKFIAAVFRNPAIRDEVHALLKNRDGLMLGICNGFQAFIKLGLVPFGEIIEPDDTCPTLTFNTIGRHMSCMVNTKICSVNSPWLSLCRAGDIHTVAVSHGEGRLIARDEDVQDWIRNGQVAMQYVDSNANASYDISFNPNQSMHAIEGLCSPDGRVLGKMAHTERYGKHVFVNIVGQKDQRLFEAGVNYFR
ncbi:MAG: phosphoribosylformylglycinamidine synthase [Christensenellales bacterium]